MPKIRGFESFMWFKNMFLISVYIDFDIYLFDLLKKAKKKKLKLKKKIKI